MSGLLDHEPKCPHCGYTLDGFDCISDPGSRPSPGDITVCGNCLTPLEFTEDIHLRRLDLEKLSAEDAAHLRAAMATAAEFKRFKERVGTA